MTNQLKQLTNGILNMYGISDATKAHAIKECFNLIVIPLKKQSKCKHKVQKRIESLNGEYICVECGKLFPF